MKIQSALIVFSFYCFDKVFTDDNNNSSEVISSTSTQQTPIDTNSTKKEPLKKLWYGEKKTIADTFGCDWPDDFQKRYNYCVEKHLPKISDKNLSSDDFGQGILNKNIMENLLNCGNNCDQVTTYRYIVFRRITNTRSG